MQAFTEEQRTFLLEGTRIGKLATVRKDGRPHLVPVWFTLDGNTLVFTTAEHSVKAANLRRDARVSLCVDDQAPPYASLRMEGMATWSTDPGELLFWTMRVAERYVGEELARVFGQRRGGPGGLLVRITPARITFLKNIISYG